MPLSLPIRNNIDTEACAYLYAAALTQPLDNDWGQIYLYVANKTYRRWRRNEVPEDIVADSVSDYHCVRTGQTYDSDAAS